MKGYLTTRVALVPSNESYFFGLVMTSLQDVNTNMYLIKWHQPARRHWYSRAISKKIPLYTVAARTEPVQCFCTIKLDRGKM